MNQTLIEGCSPEYFWDRLIRYNLSLTVEIGYIILDNFIAMYNF